MEPLVSFKEEEIFTAAVPSNCVEVSSPRPAEPTPQDPHCSCSHSRSCQTHLRGFLSVAHGIDQPITTEETDVPAASFQEKTLLQSHQEPPCPLPSFAEIVCSLQGEESAERGPTTIIRIPPEEAKEPLEVMGPSVMAMNLFQHAVLGEMYIDMITCMLTIVDLGFITMVDDHLVPALQELPNSD